MFRTIQFVYSVFLVIETNTIGLLIKKTSLFYYYDETFVEWNTLNLAVLNEPLIASLIFPLMNNSFG